MTWIHSISLLFFLVVSSQWTLIDVVGASSEWLQTGHYASYVTMNPPGKDYVGSLILVDNDSPLNQGADKFSYSWKALSVGDSRAELEVSIELVIQKAVELNQTEVVVVDLDTLETFDGNENYVGLWNLWIDARSYPLEGRVEVPYLDKWLGKSITASVGFCSPTGPGPAETGVGSFEDYFCKAQPGVSVPELGRYGISPSELLVNYLYDVNVGLMLRDAASNLADDVLYSVFDIVMWYGPPFLTLNSTNVDLTQPLVTSPVPALGRTPGLVSYIAAVAASLCGGASHLFIRRRQKGAHFIGRLADLH